MRSIISQGKSREAVRPADSLLTGVVLRPPDLNGISSTYNFHFAES